MQNANDVHVHKKSKVTVPTNMNKLGIRLDPHRREIAARIAAMISEVDPELNEISADLTHLYRAQIPVYDQVDPASIEHNTRAVLRIIVRQLGGGSAYTGFDELAALARIWADQQIPLDLVAHSIQIGARRIFDIVRQRATAAAVPATVIDEMQDLTWELATTSATAVHLVLQEQAVAGATRRADFLRRLLDGSLPPAVLATEARDHRLDPSHRYRIACAAWDDTPAASDLLATLRTRAATAKLPVIDTVIDHHLVALLPRTPDGLTQPGPIALGPAVPPTDATTSYHHARQALEIATRYGRTGLVDLSSLGPLPLLQCAADAASLLTAKHLTPLRNQGDSGAEILTAVQTFLDCDRRIDETAARLYVHRNTVRNRLTRFTELTGLDLDRTNDLVVTWWLLNRETL
ncbi:PucR family transcriptional regulator [Nocardia pseudovaccinii]|uniref:PucR family transcriptional regulator n=1 Tax=Nocardia pseudovaccinii TaxID=189540 RepID=UPI001470A735|nr:helix-turn-helix domain-containing protein [Nocardia pseudovaccinii]